MTYLEFKITEIERYKGILKFLNEDAISLNGDMKIAIESDKIHYSKLLDDAVKSLEKLSKI